MRHIRILALVAFFTGLTIAGGCAAREAGPQTGAEATLLVEGVPPVGALTIYVIPEFGGRKLVGHVSAGQDTALQFDVSRTGSYRFVAETLSQSTAVSNELYFSPGATIQWNLSSNVATLSG